jgi:hypothetical protein
MHCLETGRHRRHCRLAGRRSTKLLRLLYWHGRIRLEDPWGRGHLRKRLTCLNLEKSEYQAWVWHDLASDGALAEAIFDISGSFRTPFQGSEDEFEFEDEDEDEDESRILAKKTGS